MGLYSASLQHRPDQYVVDNSDKTYGECISNAVLDFLHLWLGASGLKLWIRVWLVVLLAGVVSPLAFLPHPFAVTNLVTMLLVNVPLTGRELIRVRGINKNMGWPHVVTWIPVVIVNVFSLTTDSIGWGVYAGQLTWDNAGDSAYEKARFVVIVFNTVILWISGALDVVDTILYYGYGDHSVVRSEWTTDQLLISLTASDSGKENENESEEGMDRTDTHVTIAVDI